MKNALLIFGFLFIQCSSDSEVSFKSRIALTDMLTLELTFGDENLPDEYLLASPGGVAVSDKGEIYVIDEDYIKMYNSQGQPVRMSAGKGQGPGELEYGINPYITNTGLLTVRDRYGSNVFRGDLSVVLKENTSTTETHKNILEKYGWESGRMYRSIYLSENERILLYIGGENYRNTKDAIQYNIVILDKDGELIEVAKYPVEHSYRTVTGSAGSSAMIGFSMWYLSRFIFSYSENGTIVYIQTGHETTLEDGRSFYNLSAYDIDSGIIKEISNQYEKTELREDVFSMWDRNVEYNSRVFPNLKEFVDGLYDIARKAKYYASIQNLLTDNEFVFVFTYKQNEKDEVFVDVLNIESGEYVSSVYFSGIPAIIKNGYAYYQVRGTDESFPKIEKFRISPEVYGR